jgi:2-(1,2-epoxy-1,2-dihydrophenyl)acetyl-CoA isomerase
MKLDIKTEVVNVNVTDGVAVVTLNRPAARNAWDDSLGDGLAEVFGGLAACADVRSIVLTGAGTAFCAGADLVAGFPARPDGYDDLRSTLRRRFHPGFLALLDLPQPVIAAVQGPAIGAGACLALACDIAVLSSSAYLQFRFAAIGLMPDVGATALLATAVGPAKATEILLLADKLDAATCQQLGLVSRITDGDAVAEARGLAARLAAGPTRAYAATKQAVRAWSLRTLPDQLELEASLQQTLVATDDWREGRSAFLERRQPRFRGR